MVAYNTQLLKERRARLPFVDAQTGIAQSDCHLWHSRLERRRGARPGQLYSYPPRRWRKETKSVVPHSKKAQLESVANGNALTTGLIQTIDGGVVTKRSSRIAGMTRKDSEGVAVVMPVSARVPLESPVSSEVNEEEESPEADLDYLEDYDSEEERRLRKKKKSSSKSRPAVIPQRSSSREQDKPYVCSVCQRRYKTASSLKAHRTQYHAGESVFPGALAPPPEEKVPVVLSPPHNLKVKELAKPNPYCDFCLGDNTCNKKSTKAEKMVSCADCGRSAHPTCMQFSALLATVVRTYRWQCIECKSCHFCGTSENDDQLLFCDDCDRGYHMYCLKPPIKEPPEGSWSCGMCLKPVSSVS